MFECHLYTVAACLICVSTAMCVLHLMWPLARYSNILSCMWRYFIHIAIEHHHLCNYIYYSRYPRFVTSFPAVTRCEATSIRSCSSEAGHPGKILYCVVGYPWSGISLAGNHSSTSVLLLSSLYWLSIYFPYPFPPSPNSHAWIVESIVMEQKSRHYSYLLIITKRWL